MLVKDGSVDEQDLLIKLLLEWFNRVGNIKQYCPQNDRILELAYQHDVALLVGDLMFLDRNQRLTNQIVKQKNLKRYYENISNFAPVAASLDRKQIKYAVTKGLYAAKMAYIDESYRRSDDIDIIIDRKDYTTVKEIIYSCGYTQGFFDYSTKKVETFSRKQELFYLSHTQQPAPFIKETGDDLIPVANLDLNFHIYWNPQGDFLDVSKLLNNSKDYNYNGFNFKILQDEYMLLHMCLHAYLDLNSIYILYKEYSYRLRYFTDIYGFIKRANITWEKFRKICINYGVEKYVMYVLFYTALIFKDDSVLKKPSLEIPNKKFLDSFGLENEGSFVWEEDFMERLFCKNRDRMVDRYLSDDIKKKIKLGRVLEGMAY